MIDPVFRHNNFYGKSASCHTYAGTGGKCRYSSNPFLTSALEGGGWLSTTS